MARTKQQARRSTGGRAPRKLCSASSDEDRTIDELPKSSDAKTRQNSRPLPPSSINMEGNPNKKQKLIVLTFKVLDKEEKVSAVIKGNLTMESSMKEVIDEYSTEYDLLISDIETYTFLTKKSSEDYHTFKLSSFHSLKVKEFISLENVNDDYVIEIKAEK